jgi:hypothetical protein
MIGEPTFALFGGINKQAVGTGPHAEHIIGVYYSLGQCEERAAKGDARGQPLRWWAVVDTDCGGVVYAREVVRSSGPCSIDVVCEALRGRGLAD